MSKLKVRFAKNSELAEVNELRRQVHKLHAKGRPDIFRKKFGRKLADFVYVYFTGETSKIIVAKAEGKICGFATIEIVHKPRSPYNKARSYLKVTELGVDKAHRRQGTGRAIFDFIKTYASAQGFDTVELDVWEFNEDALKFYESMGFTTYRRFLECKLSSE